MQSEIADNATPTSKGYNCMHGPIQELQAWELSWVYFEIGNLLYQSEGRVGVIESSKRTQLYATSVPKNAYII